LFFVFLFHLLTAQSTVVLQFAKPETRLLSFDFHDRFAKPEQNSPSATPSAGPPTLQRNNSRDLSGAVPRVLPRNNPGDLSGVPRGLPRNNSNELAEQKAQIKVHAPPGFPITHATFLITQQTSAHEVFKMCETRFSKYKNDPTLALCLLDNGQGLILNSLLVLIVIQFVCLKMPSFRL
jgi:hypothetical protein